LASRSMNILSASCDASKAQWTLTKANSLWLH
jgi:hypothetical protein